MATYHFQTKPHGTMRNGFKVNTVSHFDYIMRSGKYEHMKGREDDLVYSTSGNLPDWAEDGRDYWEEAEKQRYKGNFYKDKNGELQKSPEGRAYRDIVLSLPEEEQFTIDDYRKMIDGFLELYRISEEHVYSYAIHSKKAAFDSSHQNIHAHIMFDQRIIEKDRPLKREKYFRMYRKNKNGQPCGGYKNDRSYNSREMLKDMRKCWEELTNAMYEDKGLDIRVSSDSLQTQRDRLLEQGLYEDAACLDYPIAPHMGPWYKDPAALTLIKEISEEVQTATDNGEHYQIPKGLDGNIRKLYEYGCCMVVKKTAREVQQFRLDVLKQKADLEQLELARRIELAKQERIEQEALDKAEDYREDDPMYITGGDLVDFCVAKAEMEQEKAEDAKDAYAELAKELNTMKNWTQKDFDRKAEDLLFGGRSLDVKEKYSAVVKKLENPKQLSKKELQQLQKDRITLGRKIAQFKQELNKPERKTTFDKIKSNLIQDREAKIEKAKELYKVYKTNEKLSATHEALADKYIMRYGSNQVVAQDKVPRLLNKRCKINGRIPIEKYPSITVYIKGEAYIHHLFNEDGSIPTKEEIQNGTYKAVLLGVDIDRGTVPCYTLTMKDGKIEDIDIDKETVKLFKPRPIKSKADRRKAIKAMRNVKTAVTSVVKTFNLKNMRVSGAINKIVSKLIEDDGAVLNADWFYKMQANKERLQRAIDSGNEIEIDEALDYFES